MFFTIAAILLLDKLGRRFFLVTGTSILTLALVCMIVYIMGFAVGLGPEFWLMIAEIFPLQMRGDGDLHNVQLGLQLRDLVHLPHAD